MSNALISEDELKEKHQVVTKLLEQPGREHSIEANDSLYGLAFTYYRLFSDASACEELGFSGLSNAAVFYNRYYWFLLFSKLYQAKHGFDAGLEQQAFKLLESAGPDVDWAFVEDISNRVTKEVTRLS